MILTTGHARQEDDRKKFVMRYKISDNQLFAEEDDWEFVEPDTLFIGIKHDKRATRSQVGYEVYTLPQSPRKAL